MNNGQNLMSPQSAAGFLRRAAPEPNKRALYVGGLDPRVTEDMLKQIFEAGGTHVQTVKIIPDKNVCISTHHNFEACGWIIQFFFNFSLAPR
jgi:nucleolysin TIA-1/TIAR